MTQLRKAVLTGCLQITQGGVAIFTDRRIERGRLLHHRQHPFDAGDRYSYPPSDFGWTGVSSFLLVKPATLARLVQKRGNGA